MYPALHRLEREGLLSSSWSLEAGRRRRVYRLTGRDARRWASERREWGRFAQAVEAVLE